MVRREQGRGESKGLASLLDAAAKCSTLVVFSGSGLSATSGTSMQMLCKADCVATSGRECLCFDAACLLLLCSQSLLFCCVDLSSAAGECVTLSCTPLALWPINCTANNIAESLSHSLPYRCTACLRTSACEPLGSTELHSTCGRPCKHVSGAETFAGGCLEECHIVRPLA